MPKNRAEDRHAPGRRAVLWRPKDPKLVEQLDAAVGKGKRSETLDRLVAAFLDGLKS